MLLAAVVACDTGSVQRNAKLSNTHFLLGQDYLKRKNPQAAKQELLKALELDPENQEAHQLVGVVFFMEGVHAMNFIERRQCLKGSAASEQREVANETFRDAEKHFHKAVALSGKDGKIESEALNYLANIAIHFKRYKKAVEYTTRALENIMYGNRHMALGVRGWAYALKGDYADAARDLRQALFHQEGFCVGRYRLAKVYYEQKHYDEAIEELVRVVGDKTCMFQDPHHLLGLAYTKTRKPEKAKFHFDRCVASNPRSCLSEECRRYAKLVGQ